MRMYFMYLLRHKIRSHAKSSTLHIREDEVKVTLQENLIRDDTTARWVGERYTVWYVLTNSDNSDSALRQ